MDGDFCRSSLGILSVVARCFEARYKRGKRECNLNKQHFLMVGSSLVHPRFFFGSSLVFDSENLYKVQGKEILIKSTFSISAFFGSSLVHPWFVLGLLYEGDM